MYSQVTRNPGMKKRKVLAWIVLAGILSLCGLLYTFTMLPHDRRLDDYRQAFAQIHHPEDTVSVARYKLLGVLDYQRAMYKATYPQGCDYVAGEIRESAGDRAAVEAFYAGQTIRVDQDEERIAIRFIPFNEQGQIDRNGWADYGPRGIHLLEDIAASLLTRLDPSRSYYFVFISDLELSEPATDIRCLL
jgi:hypothetical protein